jgi:HSP20 family protein
MYLSTLKPYRRPGSIRNEIDNLLHEFFGGPIHTGPLAEEWLPPADISETKDRVFIKAELPGIEEKDIELTLLGNMMTIRGEKKHEKEEKDENHYIGDRYYGSFRRTFQLPADIDPDKAEANFDKGVLKVSVPKVEKSKSKKIQINVK